MHMRRPRGLKVAWNPARKLYEPVITEEHVLKEIVERLWWAKIKVFRINCPVGGKVRPNVAGLPDLMGWIHSDHLILGTKTICYGSDVAIPLFIEVKRPGGVRRVAQTRFIEEAKSDGCVAFFAESWGDVCREFEVAGIQLSYDVGGK